VRQKLVDQNGPVPRIFGFGETKAKLHTHCGVGEQRKCVVSFRDTEGVEHVAEVTAESLFEAAALALNQFRRADWSREESLDAGTLRVEVCESTFYNVKVAELEAWLKRTGGAPRDIIARQKANDRLRT
jgi:hypothetical protein